MLNFSISVWSPNYEYIRINCFINVSLLSYIFWHLKLKSHIKLLYIYIYVYIYGIHNWKILWSSYSKLAWVEFEPTTTEFLSDTVTNWAIRPWVQLSLRANFIQLLQFHRLFNVTFHFGCFLSSVVTFILIEVFCR